MSFDNSRFTFNHLNDYCGVVIEQGRVQMDSDWNEWLAELSRRIQAGTLDILGRAAYPATTPAAFQITATGTSLMIGPGRMYVDGLLAENHGALTTVAPVWDPALAEMSLAPQPPFPPPVSPAAPTGSLDYTAQPYMPSGTTLPAAPLGSFLAYLNVWLRPVTWLEDPNLIDKAVGVDTSGRLQTAWQVNLLSVPTGTTCASTIANWPPAPSAARLSTTTTPASPSGPCCITDSTGYTGMENQFYRVEIHQPGSPPSSLPSLPLTYPLTGPTFKWSRDNASVMTGVTAITSVTNSAGNPASQLTVLSLGRDQTLGFSPGDWIEILDDSIEFTNAENNATPGELCQIDTVQLSGLTITLTGTLTTAFPTDPTTTQTRIRRWDQSGKVYLNDNTTVWIDAGANNSTGDIPVPPSGTSLILENGVTVSFGLSSPTGRFFTGDFWTFAARTADGSVEELVDAPPRGIHHHYTSLSIVDFSVPSASDCRTEWPPASSAECGCCCTYTVGLAGSGAQYSSIQTAIAALPSTGGEICILAGIYYEHIFIEGLADVVLHGCGWQTRIASPSLNPSSPSAPSPEGGVPSGGGVGTIGTATPYAAVITVSGSEHIELRNFAVEAADSEVGILLDGTGTLAVTPPNIPANPEVVDTVIEDLVLTASTMPAILAQGVELLRIDKNRIAMQDVQSQWPAVWVSGEEIHIDRNWVGIQTANNLGEWLPDSVATDLSNAAAAAAAAGATAPSAPTGTTATVDGAPAVDLKSAKKGATKKSSLQADIGVKPPAAATITINDNPVFSTSSAVATHPGGIQIGGPSCDVFVLENQIEGGSFNGITLGSFTVIDGKGNATGLPIGVIIYRPGPCGGGVTLQPTPPSEGSQGNTTVGSSGNLRNIQIERNRICNMGLCGIGPAGFLDLTKNLEVISVENLMIVANVILNTLLGAPTVFPDSLTNLNAGYGAICLPDVQNVILRDNTVTNFGATPGLEVCGVYILNGEMVEISRNHVLENRDWGQASASVHEATNGLRGGIVIAMVTPPSFTSATNPIFTRDSYSVTISEPSLPALRVEHNVVRVPLSDSLRVLGSGPFSVVNNHFSCGGTVSSSGTSLAQTVRVVNTGLAIDLSNANGYSDAYARATGAATDNFAFNPRANSSSGAVIFTNNICQLETQLGGQRAISNVLILSLDHLIFSNNHLWVDGPPAGEDLSKLSALVDAFLFAGSLQVTTNRFQEGTGFPVLFSGITAGVLNITAMNISTYCLIAKAPPAFLLQPDNLSILSLAAASLGDPDPCQPNTKAQGSAEPVAGKAATRKAGTKAARK
jgi:hypothetical protein